MLIPSFCLSQNLPNNFKGAYSINREKKVVEVPYDEMGRIGSVISNYQNIVKYNKTLVDRNDSLRLSLFMCVKADSLCSSSNEKSEYRIRNLIEINENNESKLIFMENENRNMVKDKKNSDDRFFIESKNKKTWRTTSLIGIPVAFFVGIIINSLK